MIQSAGLRVNMLPNGQYRDYERWLKAIPPDKMKTLIAAGAIDPYWSGLPGYPNWNMQTRFYWTQKFPAHRTVVIEHSYQPITGGSMMPLDAIAEYSAKPHCIGAATMTAIRNKAGWLKRTLGDADLVTINTGYVLKTANTWAGPIGRFHLTLDRLKPGNVLSLCWDGAFKPSGPTTVEFTARNFTPVRDIDLVVVE